MADAESRLARLDAEAASLAATEVLARLLLRAESVASSRIEGLEVDGRRLLKAEAARALGAESGDLTANEVLGNIDAMAWAVGATSRGSDIRVDHLLETHRRLLSATRLSHHAGRLRTTQNWIGGSMYNPCSADFVPPPPDRVEPLLMDLCAFSNDESLPAVAQAAIAHAQFETIHPFVDGNGRIGRVLIQLILRRRGLASRVFPPVSFILATWAKEYVHRLSGTRYEGDPDQERAHDGLNAWVSVFAKACQRAVDDAFMFERRIRDLELKWRAQAGRVRKNSALDLLLGRLAGAPLVTVRGAADLIGRSFPATNQAIRRLVEAGILTPTTVGRRNRAFEAGDVLRVFSNLERQLASPADDARSSGPARRVPRSG